MQFYTLNMFMHVYNKRGRDFLHEQFYFKFFTDLILYGDFYIEGNTDVLYIMFYFTFLVDKKKKKKSSIFQRNHLSLFTDLCGKSCFGEIQ